MFQIERFTNHILDEAEETLKKDDSSKLSDEELNFAREYVSLMKVVNMIMPQICINYAPFEEEGVYCFAHVSRSVDP